MALPSSGTIWMSQIRDEYGNWGPPNYLSHYYRGGGLVPNTPATGSISTGGYIAFNQFHGSYKTSGGSWDGGAGDHSVGVPAYNWLRFRIWGSGGGGCAYLTAGGSGGTSRISGYNSVTGARYGGANNPGPGGNASGGNHTNTDGATGGASGADCRGGGGAGGAGGASYTTAGNGGFPGGGGGGAGQANGGGGGGGYSRSDYSWGWGGTFSVTVGSGGARAVAGVYTSGAGARGRILIEWGV